MVGWFSWLVGFLGWLVFLVGWLVSWLVGLVGRMFTGLAQGFVKSFVKYIWKNKS